MKPFEAPYRLLFRWGVFIENGEPVAKMVGAMMTNQVVDADDVLEAGLCRQLGEGRPFPAGAGESGLPLGEAVGQHLAEGIARLAPIIDEYPRFLEAHAELQARANRYEAEIAAQAQRIAELEAELEAAIAQAKVAQPGEAA